MDSDDGTPVSDAEVTLLDDGGDALRSSVTDSAGLFGFPVDEAASYSVRIEHLGYRTVTSRTFRVGSEERLDLELRLGREAIPLQPLVVRGRDDAVATHAPEYYQRSTRNHRLGRGRILSRDDLDPLGDRTVREALSEKMMHFTNHGYPCEPDIYWNGLETPAWDVPVTDVEGIEVYRGASQVPSRYQRDRNATDCGVVLVWSVIHRPSAASDRATEGAGEAEGGTGNASGAARHREDGNAARGVLAAVGAFVLLLALSP